MWYEYCKLKTRYNECSTDLILDNQFYVYVFQRHIQFLIKSKTYFSGSIAITTNLFGRGGGPIALNYVGCSGSEARLVYCSSNTASCSRSNEAGVRCHAQTGKIDVHIANAIGYSCPL